MTPDPAKLAACLDEEATALMNCVRVLQGMQGDREKKGIEIAPECELDYWKTMARLAQVRGQLIELRGY